MALTESAIAIPQKGHGARKQNEDKWKREKIDELEREVVRLEKLLLEGEAMGEELVVVLEGVKNVYNRAEIEGILSDFYSLKRKKSVRPVCWI